MSEMEAMSAQADEMNYDNESEDEKTSQKFLEYL
jgi:hypothetical protein